MASVFTSNRRRKSADYSLLPCPIHQHQQLQDTAHDYPQRRRIEQIGRRIGTDSQNSGKRVRSETERCREKEGGEEGGDTHLAGVTEKLSGGHGDRRQWARRRARGSGSSRMGCGGGGGRGGDRREREEEMGDGRDGNEGASGS
jgi:hypothetical protein